MATRKKLSFERLALLMLDMRLRYGEVQKTREVILQHEGRCINCAQRIDPGAAYQAHWTRRPTTGFYAHIECPPLDSSWLAENSFYQVFDYFVSSFQRCADCAVQAASVRVVVPANQTRFPLGGIVLRYVCNDCVRRLLPPRSNA